MARGAGDGDGDFVAGADFTLPSASLGTSRFEDDGFELGGFAKPGAVAVTIRGLFRRAFG